MPEPLFASRHWETQDEGTADDLNRIETGVATVASVAQAAAEARTELEIAAGVATANIATASMKGVPTQANSETMFSGAIVEAGDHVLLVGQTDKRQNGPWLIGPGSWTRPGAFATGSTQAGAFIPVAHGGSTYVLDVLGTITVDSSNQAWVGNSPGSGVLGPGSVTNSTIAAGAITPDKVSAGIVTNVEKHITASTEVVKLNAAEASTFFVAMNVAKVKFVIEGLGTGEREITIIPEWTAAGGATTFTVETAGGAALHWIDNLEPEWETAAGARGFLPLLALGGEIYAETRKVSSVTVNATGKWIAIGAGALSAMTTATGVIGIGAEAGAANTTGVENIYIGLKAGVTNKTGKGNVFIGATAGNKQTGSEATGIGYEALSQNTANNVTAVGSLAAAGNTTATGIVAVGHSALFTNKTGANNTGVGAAALELATGGGHTAVGTAAGNRITTGEEDVAIGRGAMESGTTTTQSTAIGTKALFNLETGNKNTALGYKAGGTVKVGEANVFIGWEAGAAELGSNKLYIHNSASAEPLILGDFAGRSLQFNTTLLGFYKAAAVAKPAVTGSRASGAALESLLGKLAELGLLTNSTTA